MVEESSKAGRKNKIFRDATQGYIQVPSDMVKYLIDTFEMQRLKDVAQTGIRPIYSGATHDRFSHSVGVYNIGTQIYESFYMNLLADFGKSHEELRDLGDDKKIVQIVEDCLKKYKHYYHTACILHDIGHPALSHTFEYIYDNKFLQLENMPVKIGAGEAKRLFAIYSKLYGAPVPKDTRLQSELKKELKKQNEAVLENDFKASQHEMMGAYQILCANETVREAIRKYLETQLPAPKDGERIDYVFIACMIIGAQYKLPPLEGLSGGDRKEALKKRIELSLKNCVVRLLNGLVDADSIDYLNRNAHFAGYSTSNLDVVRLCNSFSAHYDLNTVSFEPCLEKSAMSALEGFVSARHFEPRWLYSHHKIIYCEAFLVKYLYKKCARYLYALDSQKWDECILNMFLDADEVKDVLLVPYNLAGNNSRLPADSTWEKQIQRFHEECIKRGGDTKKVRNMAGLKIPSIFRFYFETALNTELQKIKSAVAGEDAQIICNRVANIVELAKRWSGFHADIQEAYYGYLMSPVGRFDLGERESWSRSSDSDINTLFKQMYFYYKDKKWEDLTPVEQAVNDRYDMFQDTLEEYQTRQYRQSLWKTEQEYFLFLSDVQARTGLSKQTISDILVNFIVKNGCREEFDDPITFQNKDERKYKAVYFNHEEKNLDDDKRQFHKMFSCFGRGMVIAIYSFSYKYFGDLKIRFKAGEDAKLIPYSELSETGKKADEYLPYIYYKREANSQEQENDAKYAERLRGELVDALTEYILEHIEQQHGGADMETTKYYLQSGKVIRDPVHGDIFVPEPFLKVVDSKVFQRLRRIKQLATADYVFPEASHTRFAHSLGTFHIMTLMMDRICLLLDYLHIQYTSQDKNAILMAALLHDVGHGPYSHAFEKLSTDGKSHEEWTCEIIEKDPELQKIFEESFGKDFSISVVECLKKNSEAPKGTDKGTLRYVFSSLISSQLDADRLDYLMRDSMNTGVKLGIVDLQKIISSLELTRHSGELAVCVSEDALPSVEQLIVGRFNMYDTVYFAPYKAFSEKLLINIVKRIGRDTRLDPKSLLAKIKNNKLTLEEYISLDDSMFQSELYQYRNQCGDSISVAMIDSFLYRNGYERLRIMDESAAANDSFIKDLSETLHISLDEVYGFVFRVETYNAYKYGTKDSILVAGRNGVVYDLAEKSKIIGHPVNSPGQNVNDKFWETIRSCVYVNYDILRQEKDTNGVAIDVNKVKELVEAYSLRRHTEIEEKYSCSAAAIKKGLDVDQIFTGTLLEYSQEGEIQTKHQEDTYYDTDDFFLAKNDCSFRCRKMGKKNYIFTIKRSIDPNNGENGGQFIRSEFELEAEDDNIKTPAIVEFLKENFKVLTKKNQTFHVDELRPKIMVKNDRKSYNVGRGDSDFKCEVSLDSVEYQYQEESRPDWQVEIELKSLNPIYRVELKEFADKFRDALGIAADTREKLSKYRKALEIFGLGQ